MTRGTLTGLPTAHPLGQLMPAVYLEDPFAQRFTQGLDTVLAPVFLTLDCIDAYLDPALTPPDFLPWLASFLGVELDEVWPLPLRRVMVMHAAALHRLRGTRRGLTAIVKLLTGGEVELVESGGVSWSDEAGGSPPGDPVPGLRLTVRVADPSAVDQRGLLAAVRETVPAGIPVAVDVVAKQ